MRLPGFIHSLCRIAQRGFDHACVESFPRMSTVPAAQRQPDTAERNPALESWGKVHWLYPSTGGVTTR